MNCENDEKNPGNHGDKYVGPNMGMWSWDHQYNSSVGGLLNYTAMTACHTRGAFIKTHMSSYFTMKNRQAI